MLQLRVVGEQQRLSGLGTWLHSAGHARNTTLVPVFDNVHNGLLLTDIGSESTTDVLAHLEETGVDHGDIAVLRTEDIGPAMPAGRASSLVWSDMLGFAQRQARPLARYVVFMTVAGVIAAYGVITVNSTLMVGAMAVSPDTLPLGGTLAVVGINVAMLLVGGTATLAFQRWLERRREGERA
jgi:hypothetical protein